jgi:hypothetical protein
MNRPGRDLGQGDKDEISLGQAGMRDFEPRRFHHRPAGQENIDIDGTGSVPDSRPSAQFGLDGLDQPEHLPGRKRSRGGDRLVDIPWLSRQSDRLGSIEQGAFQNPHPPAPQKLDGRGQVTAGVALIAPQPKQVASKLRAREG